MADDQPTHDQRERRSLRVSRLICCAVLGIALAGCMHHTVKVEPIRMTVDVTVRADRDLDESIEPSAPPAGEPDDEAE